jgi:hypothetical protein
MSSDAWYACYETYGPARTATTKQWLCQGPYRTLAEIDTKYSINSIIISTPSYLPHRICETLVEKSLQRVLQPTVDFIRTPSDPPSAVPHSMVVDWNAH